ncbi:MAG: type II toxin-antitoxin system VapC family toxin [bacterium]
MLKLPYRFIVPYPIRHSELLDFTDREWRLLDDGGMETFDLAPNRTAEAFEVKLAHPGLSANDCFCLIATRHYSQSILLTGDALLRKVAIQNSLRVHGVLWIIDQLKTEKICEDKLLISALKLWQADPSVFLPNDEIEKRIRSMKSR